jgi:hypothetical protein
LIGNWFDAPVESTMDFAGSESGSRQAPKSDSGRYWRSILESQPEPLDLPYDLCPQRAGLSQSGEYTSLSLELAPGSVTVLRAGAERRQTSLQEIGLAAFELVLTRYCRQDDFLIGIDNAEHAEHAESGSKRIPRIPLPKRSSTAGNPIVEELIARVHSAMLALSETEIPSEGSELHLLAAEGFYRAIFAYGSSGIAPTEIEDVQST